MFSTNHHNTSVIFRADGKKSIGYGHLRRVSIISQYLKVSKGLNSLLISIKDDQENFFLDDNIRSVYLDENIDFLDEVEFIGSYLENTSAEYIILDVLDADINNEYMRRLNLLGLPIIVITDDTYKRLINADLIINGNPNQLEIDYGDHHYKYLLGPKYFIMPEIYGETLTKPPTRKKKKDILLTLGGSDHNNLIFKVLIALRKLNNIGKITLISSKATGYLGKLINFIKTSTLNIELLIDVPNLAPFFNKVDLAITAGGNTLFERIAIGLPGLTICQLTRQDEIANMFQKLNVNFNIGYGPDLNINDIYNNVNYFLNDDARHIVQHDESQKIVDGKGLKRFCNKLEQLKKVNNGLW